MATPIGARVLYKTGIDWVPAIITRAYDVNGAVVDNLAETDTSIVKADLLVLGVDPVKLSLVSKEVAVSGNDGSIAAGSNARTTAASMTTGTWFNFS